MLFLSDACGGYCTIHDLSHTYQPITSCLRYNIREGLIRPWTDRTTGEKNRLEKEQISLSISPIRLHIGTNNDVDMLLYYEYQNKNSESKSKQLCSIWLLWCIGYDYFSCHPPIQPHCVAWCLTQVVFPIVCEGIGWDVVTILNIPPALLWYVRFVVMNTYTGRVMTTWC